MKISDETQGNTTIVSPEGILDAKNSSALSEKLQQLANDKHTKVTIDFSKVEHITSEGLRALLVNEKLFQKIGGTLRLCGINQSIQDALEASGISNIFNIHSSLEDAVDKTVFFQANEIILKIDNAAKLPNIEAIPNYLLPEGKHRYPFKATIDSNDQATTFPIHLTPSKLDSNRARVRNRINYEEAIQEFAKLLLAHKNDHSRILVYASAQLDYFAIFAIQEVFRLLGVRNIAANSEHSLNSMALSNECLTGQEGPLLTQDQCFKGPNRLYLLSGWNGAVTHGAAFESLMKKDSADVYLVDVMETESAQVLIKKQGYDNVLLIKSGADSHLALAIAHEILDKFPHAVESRFINYFANHESYENYIKLVNGSRFDPQQVAQRIAPEPEYVDQLASAIRSIASKLAQTETVPIHIPSVGLSQTSGVAALSLWSNLLALLGKYGLRADGSVAGGVLSLPGQSNAATAVQGLSSNYFMGRIPIDNGIEAARRMELPDNAYVYAINDTPRPALDYSDSTPEVKELFICIGTQFESNMMERGRWIKKLEDPNTKFVVIDPVPDPFSTDNAQLIIPTSPLGSAARLVQDGEWRLSLCIPHKQAPEDIRSDATVIYDVIAEITQMLTKDPDLLAIHPDLGIHINSGYLNSRFVSPSPEETITKKNQLSIGRSVDNDLTITDGTISSHHATLNCLNAGKSLFRIRDLGSSNGVYKNGQKISDAEFTLDDTITLGIVELSSAEFLPLICYSTEEISGLIRIDGEVSRPQLWERIMHYMSAGKGPLYCRPEYEDGFPIQWHDLMHRQEITYGGVGTRRCRIDYETEDQSPFADIFRQPQLFNFFTPSEEDLQLIEGLILNSGRSALSDDPVRLRYARETFNSGKVNSPANMSEENPLYISVKVAEKFCLKEGDQVQVTNTETGALLILTVSVTTRLLGDTVYTSFHKSKAQLERGKHINVVTSHADRCPYSQQTRLKLTTIDLKPLEKIGEDRKQIIREELALIRENALKERKNTPPPTQPAALQIDSESLSQEAFQKLQLLATDASKRTRQAEAERQSAIDRAKQLEAELETLRKKFAETEIVQQANQQQLSDSNDFEKDYLKLKGRLEELHSKHDEQIASISKSTSQITLLSEQSREKDQQISQQAQQLEEAQSDLAKLKTEKQRMRQENEHLLEEIQTIKGQLETIETANQKVKNDVEEMTKENDELRDNIANLEEQGKNELLRRNELENQTNELIQNFEKLIAAAKMNSTD